MRKVILTLMASLLSCSTVSAFWPEAVASSLEIGVGYRNDEITRKTGSGGNSSYSGYYSSYNNSTTLDPIVQTRSDIKYKNLNIWDIQASGKYITCDDIYLRACGDYGWITHGKTHREDYVVLPLADTSVEVFDDSQSTKGHVYDAKIGVGYMFHFCDDSFGLAPVIGYSWHGQHLKHHTGDNYSNYDSSSSYDSSYSTYYDGSYGSAGSRYNTRWDGPFVGIDMDYKFMCEWTIFADYEFHWANFHAKGHDDLFSTSTAGSSSSLSNRYHQRSDDAYGHVLDFGVKYDLNDCWSLSVKGEFQWWDAHHAHQSVKISETDFGNHNKQECYAKSRIKRVDWRTAGVVASAAMMF